MKILVTGGTGFIGNSLCRRLLQEGHQVRILDDDSRGVRGRLSDVAASLEWTLGDVRNPECVLQAVAGMDCVCHLAAVNGTEYFYSKPELVLEVAVKGMINVLEACRAGGVRQLITASSSEVYQNPALIPTDETVPLSVPDPLNPRYSYGGGKIISELLTLNYGRTYFDRVMVVRPHNVYGPDMGREHVIPQLILRMVQCRANAGGAKRFDFPIQGDGSETRAYLFIEDMVSGIVTLLNHGQHLNVYHVGNPLETTVRELVAEIARQLDVDPVIIPGPLQPGSVRRRCPDITKIRHLGYVPEIDLREGLKRTIPWYSR